MRRLFPGRLLFLFVSILTFVVLSPFLQNSILGHSILYMLAVAACVATVYGLRLGKKPVILTLFLAISSVVLGVATFFVEARAVYAAAVFTNAVFYSILIGLLISYIVSARKVTADILFGSVCVYLLIGIVFSMIYRFIDILDHTAFSTGGEIVNAHAPGQGEFTYFSFVTLTTLGYGDIQPLSRYARTFAFIEAIIGTLYVATLISRLVSMYITDTLVGRNK